MELIYIWIENFRNIKKMGMSLNKGYNVLVESAGYLSEDVVKEKACENHLHNMKEIENLKGDNLNFRKVPYDKDLEVTIPKINLQVIEGNEPHLNIFMNNIVRGNTLVGKNSSGKTNILTCIGDLHTSLDESSFCLVYADGTEGKIILECNQISVNFNGHRIDAVKGSFQPTTTVVKIEGNSIKNFEDDIVFEYIYISHMLNDMLYPNANNFSSVIPRFGLSYNRAGNYYKYIYLMNDKNIESYTNNEIDIKISIFRKYTSREDYIYKLLPEKYPGKKHYIDFAEEGDELYKKLFIIRLVEVMINTYRFPEDKVIKDEIELMNSEIDDCKSDVDKILKNYPKFKEIMISMKKKLMMNNMENTVDISMCYDEFWSLLVELIEQVPERCFRNSYEIKLSMKDVIEQGYSEKIKKLLFMMEDSQVSMEFSSNLKIEFLKLSDGLNSYLNLFSTISTCMTRNEVINVKNVILLLDEPEDRLHPELARRFMYYLIRFLSDYYTDYRFQLIITTHSPFILSDFTSKDIIRIYKNNNCIAEIKDISTDTFGGNIHNIMKNAFFMDHSIGMYSKSFIEENIIDKIKPDRDGVYPVLNDEEYIKLKKKIDVIGEKIVKNKLMDMLGMCHSSLKNKTKRKKFLERQIAKMNEELNSLGSDSDD